MAGKRRQHPGDDSSASRARLDSAGFKKALVAALDEEVGYLATLTLAEVVEPRLVHEAIDAWSMGFLDRKHAVDLLVAANDVVVKILRDSGLTPQDLLGAHSAKEVEALLFGNGELSEGAEGFVADLMQQEFTRQLFTEIIFTSIVSFNKKFNPFGSFAMRAMEDQIKGFIRLFMPMVQSQAAAFAVDNQEALQDLATKMLREAWHQPLHDFVRAPSAKRRAAATALLRHALANSSLEELSRTAAHAVWDSICDSFGKRTLGEIFELDRHKRSLAEKGAEVILPFLGHPAIAGFLHEQSMLATEPASSEKPSRRVARRPGKSSVS